MNIKESITNFVEVELQNNVNEYYTKNYSNLDVPKMEVTFGRKYAKILNRSTVWGFVDLANGDLLKAASWRTPARHSRGNILNGTAQYNVYGPAYLK
jgi:hypothetical protein